MGLDVQWLPVLTQNGIVDGGHSLRHAAVGELLGVSRQGALPNRFPANLTRDDSGYGELKALGTARFGQDSVDPVTDGFRYALHAAGHDGNAGGHRLQDDHGQAFAEQAGQNKQIQLR